MKKKLFASVLALALTLSFSIQVFAANDPVTEIVQITPDPIYVGEEFTLEATTQKQGNHVTSYWTYSGTQLSGVMGPVVDGFYVDTITLKAPLTPGPLTIEYYIQMFTTQGNNGPINNTWTVEDEIVVNILVRELVTVENKAAPAIANELLKAAGVSHRYGKNGNYISDVAKHMGEGATFNNVSKDKVVEYEAAVKAFLLEIGALK